MEVLVTPEHGFCLGVRKAVELARKLAETARGSGRGVWTLGPLIHNRRVVQALETEGVRVAAGLDDVPAGDVLILPSHGVGPDVITRARARGVLVEDATCPLVRKVQASAKSLREEGYQVVVVGERRHTEVVGVVGWAGGEAVVVESPQEAEAVPAGSKLAVISQTTQRPERVRAVVEALKRSASGAEIRVEPTLCHATSERQRQTRELASKVDVLLVVGGRESANTRKLVEVGREMGRRVYHIEAAHEVEPSWFSRDDKVGITAGTSTPDWITEEVVARMKGIESEEEAKHVEPKEAAPPEASPEETGSVTAGTAGPAEVALEPGARVTGTVVKVGDKDVLVDIGYKTEGVIPAAELSRRRVSRPQDVLKVGDVVEATVLRVDEEGHPILSRRKIEEDKAWTRLEEAAAANLTIEAPVTAHVKGGLVADVGTRGFIPASQVGLEFIQDLSPYVGKTLRVKVIEVDRGERRVILSEKKALEEERQEQRRRLLETVQEGEIRSGQVKRVADYGAFVDIGGVDGLLHVSEMSWKRVTDPREVVKEGDRIDVKVLKVDRERGRISLGLKQVQGDPWADVAQRFPVGTVVNGRVVSVADFGAFVELAEGVEGLVHVSQLSDKRVARAQDVVKVGDELRVKVLKVNPKERRISLSAREGEEEMNRRDVKKFLKATNDTAGVTIGDLVGNVFKGSDLGDKKDAKPEDGGDRTER